MKIPRTPPDFDAILDQSLQQMGRLPKILEHGSNPLVNGRYVHWDKLRYLPPPGGLTHEEWWVALKFSRLQSRILASLTDSINQPFSFNLVDPLPECLHEIDSSTRGTIGAAALINNEATRDQYVVRSLIEEALTSSQLEGASATRDQAKQMVREGRTPATRGERMVWNNYQTMQRIRGIKDEALTRDLIFELQRIVTDSTLDDPSASGRFRRADERIVVADEFGLVFHTPPPAGTLNERLARLCDFANGCEPAGFLHPVIRSICLHFWLAYDHPFVDGNGRTARALFYWSMLRQGYWLFEFVSISSIILKAPSRYGRAFLHTETDGNDLTYFLLYHADVIRRSVRELNAYLDRRTREVSQAEVRLRGLAGLNPRQKELVSRALQHPHETFSIQGHQVSHNTVYETARSDLQDLVDRGLFERLKQGRAFRFRAVLDLEERLQV